MTISVQLRTPITISGGVIASIEFSRVTIGEVLALADKGDILSPEAAAAFAASHGTGKTADGREVKITEDDVLDATSPALGLSAVVGLTQAREFSILLVSGEVINPKPMMESGETIIRLAHPVTLDYGSDGEDRAFKLEWLGFEPQKYRDIGDFVRSYVTNSPDRVKKFIQAFARIPNAPDGYPIKHLTERNVLAIDASDGERIGELVMPNFIELPA